MSTLKSSPLVSLNVHEALTFEGTEICLHPDLFSLAATGETSRHASISSNLNQRISLASTQSSEEKISVTSSQNSQSIQVGDMIEIRVWDPIVRNKTIPSPPRALLPKRAAANASQQSLPVSTLSSASSNDKLETESRPINTGRKDSLQYSEASAVGQSEAGGNVESEATSISSSGIHRVSGEATPRASPGAQSVVSNSEEAPPPPKTVVTSGELPPMFPRSRTNTADGMNPLPKTPLAKPPIAQRRVSAPTDPKHKSTIVPKPKHNRELSDVTVDSFYGGDGRTFALEASQQLVDLQVPMGLVDFEDGDGSSEIEKTHSLRLSFVMKVTEQALTSLKGNAMTRVSLLRTVADLYELSSYDKVTVHRIEKSEEEDVMSAVSADFVLVTIKDQFVSRGEMHLFQRNLIGSWIYEGQRLHDPVRGIQSHAREIRHKDQHSRSGIVTEDTTITFRSRSSRIFWLVQMSVEMWDYASPYETANQENVCEVYFDRFIKFAHELFAKWKTVEATHSLTVVFFSRTFLPVVSALGGRSGKRDSTTRTDVYGRMYEDHYNVVIEDEKTIDWDSLVVRMKEAFVRYPHEIGWSLSVGEDARLPSSANQGNLLEAINVTLNLLQYHYLDRDLHRTGNSILVVSAGSGVFEVDKDLSAITYQRMMDNGIGSDMLSLGLPPLHIAPFFLYVNNYHHPRPEAEDGENYYEVPHWMHLSFSSYPSDSILPGSENISADGGSKTSPVPGLSIGPNGFILGNRNSVRGVAKPKKPSSPVFGPTSFTAEANAAASPARKPPANRERQLIAGRDFEDILEACRPRRIGTTPSSLRTMISLYKPKTSADDDETVNSNSLLREWSSLEPKSRTKHPVRQSDSQKSASFISSGVVNDEGKHGKVGYPNQIARNGATLAASSPGSSTNSHYSGLLGVSYDRPLLAHLNPPALSGLQIQKSVPLDLAATEECESGENADVTEALFHKLMRQTDSSILLSGGVKPVQLDPVLQFSDPVQRVASTNNITVASPAGGIGAALTTYGGAPSIVAPTENENNASFGIIPRVNSHTMLLGQSPKYRARLNDMTARGLSPLLLPPAITMPGTGSPEGINMIQGVSGQGNLEQRLVHPSEYSTGFSDGTRKLRRQSMAGSGQRSLSQSRSRNDMQISGSPPVNRSTGIIRAVTDHPIKAKSRDAGSLVPRQRQPTSGRRKARVFNPFRQEDEDEVLAKKSHNRRRWSHVFPLGEVEFKRHAGPNWKSLSSPAILPMSIDYIPPQHEIQRDFTFGIYHVGRTEFDNPHYSSTKELIDEMIRQRLTQDYQLVPPSHVNASNYNGDSLRATMPIREGEVQNSQKDADRYFLSMGHRLQVLTHDPTSDTVEVIRYNATESQVELPENSIRYFYYASSADSQSYTKVVQTFNKYTDLYNWNKLDRIVCGNADREMEDKMRSRRVMFGIIPDDFGENGSQEDEYIAKFQRLLEYLQKLRKTGDVSDDEPLGIRIVSSTTANEAKPLSQKSTLMGIERESMKRFYVPLRKRKQDPTEWIEIAVDSTFNTNWSYRIVFNWLVASSPKVDTQIQLFQRRCSQYGLNLVPLPQGSVAPDVLLNPFRAPSIFMVRDNGMDSKIEDALVENCFIYDGKFRTKAKEVVECTRNGSDFSFRKGANGHQYLHRSGTLFVRIVRDSKGTAMLIAFSNARYVGQDVKLKTSLSQALATLRKCMDDTNSTPISD